MKNGRYQMSVVLKGNTITNDFIIAVIDTQTSEVKIVKFCDWKDEILKTFTPFKK